MVFCKVLSFVSHAGFLFAIMIFLSTTAASGESGKRYVKTAKGKRAEPIVAVDHVCAWPNNLTTLRDGTIVAAIYNKPSHAWIAGDTVCVASTDGGRSWHKRGTPAPADPNTLRAYAAAGLAENGDLVVVCGGFSNTYSRDELRRSAPSSGLSNAKHVVETGLPFRSTVLPPWVSRSSDGGRTWTVDKQTFPDLAPNGGTLWPYGQIVQGDDRTLYCPIYSTGNTFAPLENQKFRVYLYPSRDNGKTWGDPICMDKDAELNETSLLHLDGRKWLAAARFRGLHLYESNDDARTWHLRGRLTGKDQNPGHLLRLRDGRLVLSYGSRTEGDCCIQVRSSSDEGKTWSKPIRVVDVQHRDSGHPSSVQLPDGQVVTAYYAPRIQYHVSYYMGVVIWDPNKSLDH